MDRVKTTECPLCGGQQMEHVWTCTDRYASGEEFEVCRCTKCGFFFTQDVPAPHEIGRYYETPDYISHSDTRSGLMNRIYHTVRSYMLQRKARLVAEATGVQRGRLLDIGTGTGYFPHTMQQRGWQVEAVEQSQQARDFARQHFGLEVKPADTWQNMAAGSFDAVTLWHVLEHLPHPDEVGRQLRRLLKPNGRLIVAVPNCSSYDARHYGADWAAYDVPRHLWHFTPATLDTWARRQGLQVVKMLPMPMDAFYVSMLTEKELGRSASFVRGLIVGLKAWMACLGHPQRSSSLIYVLKANPTTPPSDTQSE